MYIRADTFALSFNNATFQYVVSCECAFVNMNGCGVHAHLCGCGAILVSIADARQICV